MATIVGVLTQGFHHCPAGQVYSILHSFNHGMSISSKDILDVSKVSPEDMKKLIAKIIANQIFTERFVFTGGEAAMKFMGAIGLLHEVFGNYWIAEGDFQLMNAVSPTLKDEVNGVVKSVERTIANAMKEFQGNEEDEKSAVKIKRLENLSAKIQKLKTDVSTYMNGDQDKAAEFYREALRIAIEFDFFNILMNNAYGDWAFNAYCEQNKDDAGRIEQLKKEYENPDNREDILRQIFNEWGYFQKQD